MPQLRSVNMGLSKEDFDKIKNIVKTMFSNDFLETVAESVAKIIRDKFDKTVEAQNQKIKSLEEKIKQLQVKNSSLEMSLDSNEQSSRNQNIRIFNMPTKDNENIREVVLNIFNNTMKLNIKTTDLKKCHRVQNKTPGDKPSAVLVQFSSDGVRKSVLQKRKQLKSTGFVIKEDLTQRRLSLYKKAVEKFTARCVWCLNGNIYAKKPGGEVLRLSDEGDLDYA